MRFKEPVLKHEPGVCIPNTSTAQFTVTHSFSNNLSFDVNVCDHNNIFHRVERSKITSQAAGDFYIYTTFVYTTKTALNSVFKVLRYMKENRARNTGFFNQMLNTVEKLVSVTEDKGYIAIKFGLRIREEEFFNNDSIFDPGSNYLITTDESSDILHPLCEEKLTARGPNYEFDGDARPGGLALEVVDTVSGQYKLFSVLSGKVMEVPVRTNSARPDGLYVYYLGAAGKELKTEFYSDRDKNLNPSQIPYEEALKKFGIYRSKHDAELGGRQDLKLEKELKDKEEALSNLKLRLEEQKLEAEEAKIRHQKEKEAMERERLTFKDKLETKQMRQSDYYETRSAERKDTSEWIKFIPAVLMGFIGAALLFKK